MWDRFWQPIFDFQVVIRCYGWVRCDQQWCWHFKESPFVASDLLFALNFNISKMSFYNPYQANKTSHHLFIRFYHRKHWGYCFFFLNKKTCFINDAIQTVYVLLIAHKIYTVRIYSLVLDLNWFLEGDLLPFRGGFLKKNDVSWYITLILCAPLVLRVCETVMRLSVSSRPLQKRAVEDQVQLPVSHLWATSNSVGLIQEAANDYLSGFWFDYWMLVMLKYT